jgi:uncharacterized protein YkwD
MRLHLLAGALAVSLAFFAASQATSAHTWGYICDAPDVVIDEQEALFLEKINGYRISQGLPPLVLTESLMYAAGWMSGDLAWRNYMSHTDWFGRDSATRQADCGNWAPYRGEIIAAGTTAENADAVMSIWLSSPNHHAQMLVPQYQTVGISRFYNPASTYGWYWVVDFGSE